MFDGNKRNIAPRSLSPRPGFNDAVLLDSTKSRFYTLSLPLSQESLIKEFAGSEIAGFSDGDASTATFKKPESFAVDLKGNVYVADRKNHAIRKISNSGTVTTIAGGYSNESGHADGPGRNATFSFSFEPIFVPDMCALLILDYGQKLIRQISLKQENCIHSESGPRLFNLVSEKLYKLYLSSIKTVPVSFCLFPPPPQKKIHFGGKVTSFCSFYHLWS